ncbi:BON domain-containing protein [Phenylobacterium sp.]|uniref:BON domain-containing protein n=1 Tax=Phenylobacterium sp. TaxID=1871053 RepID=UPI002B747060|nr:BON domain-containing protein [Phenylobacterium sp.]HVI31595.1 BON domain-containing protein [Phenylobacterium sp.]
MADRDTTPRDGGQAGFGQAGFQGGELGGGVRKPGYGRGYGRDFGAGGLNQGFDGSWGQGYGGSVSPSDYREGFGGEAYGGGMSGADYERSFGPRGEDFGADDRNWMDQRADERSGPHAGRGPRGWSRTDARIREAVSEALMEDPLIDAREIEVQVDGGVVTLSGEVPGASDVHRAEQLARRCGGVGEVRNDLQVHGRARRDLTLHGEAGEAPNAFHPPGQDHAVTADQRNAALGKGGDATR